MVGVVRGDVFDPTFDPTFVGATAPYYMYGHKREIAWRLSEADQGEVAKFEKYPLFVLNIPTPGRVANGFVEYDLNIAILSYTDKHDRAPGRYDTVIKPILLPLYESFMDAIVESGYGWEWEGDTERPPHTQVDRPFYGVEEVARVNERNGGEAYPFNDPLDAIEILNLRMKKRLC